MDGKKLKPPRPWRRFVTLKNVAKCCIVGSCVAAFLFTINMRIEKYFKSEIVIQEKFGPYKKSPQIVLCPNWPWTDKIVYYLRGLCGDTKFKKCKNDPYNGSTTPEHDAEHEKKFLQLADAGASLEELYDFLELENVTSKVELSSRSGKHVVLNTLWTKELNFQQDYLHFCFRLNISRIQPEVHPPFSVFIHILDVIGRNEWGFVRVQNDDNRRLTYIENIIRKTPDRRYIYKVVEREVVRFSRKSTPCEENDSYNVTKCRLSSACQSLKAANLCRNEEDFVLNSSNVKRVERVVLDAMASEGTCLEKCNYWDYDLQETIKLGKWADNPGITFLFNNQEHKVEMEVWSDSLLSIFSDIGAIIGILFGFSILATYTNMETILFPAKEMEKKPDLIRLERLDCPPPRQLLTTGDQGISIIHRHPQIQAWTELDSTC